MKKYFLMMAVIFGMVLAFTACGGNTDADTSDSISETKAEIQVENQADIQIEDQTENQDDAQVEVQAALQDENKTEPQQVSEAAADDNESENEEEKGERAAMKMNVQVGDYTFTATLENNTAVDELVEMMKEGPVTISMGDYSGFEKVGSLGKSLTTSNSQMTTDAGDIVLYNGNNIVMFYGSNSWSYTRIGKIDDLTDWNKALGSGSVTAIFTLVK